MLTGGVLLVAFLAQAAEHKAGMEQYGARKYAAAAESFQKSLAAEKPGSPEYVESAVLLGQSSYLLGRYRDAIPALLAGPRTNESAYMLGNSYLKFTTYRIPYGRLLRCSAFLRIPLRRT